MTTAEVTWVDDPSGLAQGLQSVYPNAYEFMAPDPTPFEGSPTGGLDDRLPQPLVWSLHALGLMAGLNPSALDVSSLRWRELDLLEDRRAVLLTGGVTRSIWDAVSLSDHECDPGAGDFAAAFADALQHLQSAHPHFAGLLLELAPVLVLARSRLDVVGEPTITSASAPVMPGLVFTSRKIFRHIPPKTLAEAPVTLLAAENLSHEAVHQLVNLVLLTQPVLRGDYSAQASPRVAIPWRQGQGVARNERWELDRVLHATAVYVGLVHFRVAELAVLPSDACATPYFRRALREGLSALDYLSSSLVAHADLFDDFGARLVRALREDAEAAMAAA